MSFKNSHTKESRVQWFGPCNRSRRRNIWNGKMHHFRWKANIQISWWCKKVSASIFFYFEDRTPDRNYILMAKWFILKRFKMDHMSFIPFSRVKGAINLHTCNPIPVCKSTCKHDHTRNTTIHRYMPCCLIQVVTGNWKPVLDRFERIYRMAFQQLRAENHRSDQMIT